MMLAVTILLNTPRSLYCAFRRYFVAARRNINRYWFIVLPLLLSIAYLLYIAWLYGPWTSVDTISYFKVAEYYASFQFDKAINGMWSPLLSWLLVPGVWLGINVTIWVRLLHILLVLGILLPLSLYIARKGEVATGAKQWAVASVLAATGVTFSWWAMREATPDFLSAVVSLYALVWLGRCLDAPSVKRGVVLGVLLAALFFAKFAAIIVCFVVLVSLLTRCIVQWRKKRSFAPTFQCFVSAAGIFIMSLLGWSGAMAYKYDTIALSSTGSFNFALNGPNANGYQQIDYPNKLLPVPYEDSVTPWDDPTNIPPESWQLEGNEIYYARHIGATLGQFVWLFFTMSPLVLLGVFGLRQKTMRRPGLFIILIATSVAIGYSFYHVWERFLYLVLVPWLAYGVIAIGRVRQLSKVWSIIVIGVCAVAVGGVTYNTVQVQPAARYMHSFIKISHDSVGIIPSGSRVAVQALEFLPYCYHLGVQCPALNYKLTDDEQANDRLIEQARRAGVGYYMTRTPVTSQRATLLARYSIANTSHCLVRGSVVPCGAAYALFYKLH